jgi:hypothetical protein
MEASALTLEFLICSVIEKYGKGKTQICLSGLRVGGEPVAGAM